MIGNDGKKRVIEAEAQPSFSRKDPLYLPHPSDSSGLSIQGSHQMDKSALSQQLKPISIFQVQPQRPLDIIYVHGSLPRRPHTKIPAVCAGGGRGPHCPEVEPDPSFSSIMRATDTRIL